MGMALILLPFWAASLEDLVFLLGMGYWAGLGPAVLGGVLFAVLRRWFGSGYTCAGACGGLATALSLVVAVGVETSPMLLFYAAGFAGILPALGTRLLAQRFFPAQPQA